MAATFQVHEGLITGYEWLQHTIEYDAIHGMCGETRSAEITMMRP